MPKFNKTEDELETDYDKWLYLLKNISELEKIPERLQKFLFTKVFNLAEVSNYNQADRQQYEESLKEYRDYYNTITTAEKKARKEGKREGMQEGLIQGKQEGSYQKAIEVAKEGLKQGIDIHLLANITKLSVQELQEIEKSRRK